jgi:ribonuclease P protein component
LITAEGFLYYFYETGEFMKGIAVLKRNTDFRRLYRQGKSAVTSTLVVYAMPNRQGTDRLGLTAGKKVGCAVKRNRAKRRLRALFADYSSKRLSGSVKKSCDFVIVARAAAVDANPARLRADFETAVSKVIKAAGV